MLRDKGRTKGQNAHLLLYTEACHVNSQLKHLVLKIYLQETEKLVSCFIDNSLKLFLVITENKSFAPSHLGEAEGLRWSYVAELDERLAFHHGDTESNQVK